MSSCQKYFEKNYQYEMNYGVYICIYFCFLFNANLYPVVCSRLDLKAPYICRDRRRKLLQEEVKHSKRGNFH